MSRAFRDVTSDLLRSADNSRPKTQNSTSAKVKIALSRASAGQRIHVLLCKERRAGREDVYRRGVGTLALREGPLDRAGAGEHASQSVVSLMTSRLVVNPIRAIVLPHQLLLHRPRLRPR